jgi:NAD(P)-dependent dehydrogenase (short-subunit alcohol dehydrogenase family)
MQWQPPTSHLLMIFASRRVEIVHMRVGPRRCSPCAITPHQDRPGLTGCNGSMDIVSARWGDNERRNENGRTQKVAKRDIPKDAASYSASKWGILGLMKSAGMELGQYNITVNALIPGLVDTALTRYDKRLGETIAETGRPEPEHPSPEEAWNMRAPTVPMKVGWLQPDDISPAAVFLASDAANMVTGAEYEVTDGDSAKDI